MDEKSSKVIAKLFLVVADEWGLSKTEITTLLGASDCFPYEGPNLLVNNRSFDIPDVVLERMMYTVEIYKNSHNLFSSPERCNEWIRKPNRNFENRSALEVMLLGDLVNLKEVYQYVTSMSGEHYL